MEEGVEKGGLFEGVEFGVGGSVDPFGLDEGDGEGGFFCARDEGEETSFFCEDFEDAAVFEIGNRLQ